MPVLALLQLVHLHFIEFKEIHMFKKLELLLPPFPLTIVLCGVIFLCAKLTPNFTLNIPSGMEWGVAFWALGFGFILPAVLSFVKAKTTVDPRKPDKR